MRLIYDGSNSEMRLKLLKNSEIIRLGAGFELRISLLLELKGKDHFHFAMIAHHGEMEMIFSL